MQESCKKNSNLKKRSDLNSSLICGPCDPACYVRGLQYLLVLIWKLIIIIIIIPLPGNTTGGGGGLQRNLLATEVVP